MRLAVAGKGGAGKTTVSACLALLAARAGQCVVAIDADANPNLSTALGIPPAGGLHQHVVPPALVSRRQGGAGLLAPVDDVLEEYGRPGPDGLRVVEMGAPRHAEEGCLCSAHAVVSALLEDLGGADRTVVVDMEASPEHLSRGTIRHVDVVLLVTEPYYRSLETVRRMAALATELPVPRVLVLANKVRSADDQDAVAEFCARHALSLTGAVPWQDAVGIADRRRVPVVDQPGAEPFLARIAEVAAALSWPAKPGEEGTPGPTGAPTSAACPVGPALPE